MIYLYYESVNSWCAGINVSGVTDSAVSHPSFPSVEKMMEQGVVEVEGSVLLITVNVEEKRVLEWLKANKFRKGPMMKNWGHGGRQTLCYFKQIPRKLWRKVTGCTNEYGDDYD